MPEAVITEQRNSVLLITLNRPDAMNAINTALAEGLLEAVARLDGDDDLRAAVVTGAGRGFCAGMDLKAYLAEGTPSGFMPFAKSGAVKPLVAAVEGFALAGGLEIALACDLIVAARGAKLGIPEVVVGLFAAGGGIMRLPQRLPYGVAMEMALTGDPITAETAFEHGFIARLADPGRATEVAIGIAERIGRNAPLAVAASKRLIRETNGRTEADFWALQQSHFEAVFSSQDGQEGPRAFSEKRTPIWTGR